MAKESIYGVGIEPVFRETFNDQQTVEQNGGRILNGEYDFKDGRLISVFSGAYILYPYKFNPPLSIRFRGVVNSSIAAEYILDGRLNDPIDIYLLCDDGTVSTIPGGIIYVNGVLGTSYNIGEEVEIVVTYAFLTRKISPLLLLSRYTITTPFVGEADVIEIYDTALTAEEVSNLYANSRYKELSPAPVLHVTAENGYIEDRAGNSYINTDVEVVRDGQVYAPKYNGSASNLNFGDTSFFGENFTISFWLRRGEISTTYEAVLDKSIGDMTTTSGRGLIVFFNLATNDFRFRVVDITTGVSAVLLLGFDVHGVYNHYAITRQDTDFIAYKDGIEVDTEVVPSGFDVEQATDLVIGEWQLLSRHINGLISDVRIYNGALSAEQVSEMYTSTKFKYKG